MPDIITVTNKNDGVQIYPRHACREYLETVDKFGFTLDSVPQLEDISQILQVRPWARRGAALASRC